MILFNKQIAFRPT